MPLFRGKRSGTFLRMIDAQVPQVPRAGFASSPGTTTFNRHRNRIARRSIVASCRAVSIVSTSHNSLTFSPSVVTITSAILALPRSATCFCVAWKTPAAVSPCAFVDMSLCPSTPTCCSANPARQPRRCNALLKVIVQQANAQPSAIRSADLFLRSPQVSSQRSLAAPGAPGKL